MVCIQEIKSTKLVLFITFFSFVIVSCSIHYYSKIPKQCLAQDPTPHPPTPDYNILFSLRGNYQYVP